MRHPDLPASITADQLDPEARDELRTLPGDLADAVARLLVATSLAEDPDRAYQYAEAARGLAARVGIVRETCAIAAYQAGNWTAALAEFRAARRLTGRASYLPLMADCERALGRPDRALDIVTGPEARAADRPTQLELKIVESGIRRDQGLPEAAVAALQVPELSDRRSRPGSARLLYAYADALLDAGREEDAREWFGKAAAADSDGETDAADRMDELDDFILDDLEFDENLEAEPEAGNPQSGSSEVTDAEMAEAGAADESDSVLKPGPRAEPPDGFEPEDEPESAAGPLPERASDDPGDDVPAAGDADPSGS